MHDPWRTLFQRYSHKILVDARRDGETGAVMDLDPADVATHAYYAFLAAREREPNRFGHLAADDDGAFRIAYVFCRDAVRDLVRTEG